MLICSLTQNSSSKERKAEWSMYAFLVSFFVCIFFVSAVQKMDMHYYSDPPQKLLSIGLNTILSGMLFFATIMCNCKKIQEWAQVGEAIVVIFWSLSLPTVLRMDSYRPKKRGYHILARIAAVIPSGLHIATLTIIITSSIN